MITSTIFAFVLVTAFGFFLYSVRNVISYLRLGKNENRLHNIPQRIINTLNIAFLQNKLFRSRLAGFLHFCIYWGFLILSL
ncbi:MAG: Fe-S oxidoreductase, partial [Ignavibacteria bacterium]|nr:Fe-S oxidoreductase [Ignavibacteria bacterium]